MDSGARASRGGCAHLIAGLCIRALDNALTDTDPAQHIGELRPGRPDQRRLVGRDINLERGLFERGTGGGGGHHCLVMPGLAPGIHPLCHDAMSGRYIGQRP